MRACADGEHGRVVTTSFTLDELAGLATGGSLPEGWARRVDRLIGPGERDATPLIQLIHPSGATLERAYQRYLDWFDQGLSLTDHVQLAVMEEENIETIATFDQGFHGLVHVIPEPEP